MLNTMSPGAVRFRLSKILKERGIKQIELAQKAGLSENAVSDLTGEGVRQIRLDTIARICDALNITPADLLEYIPDVEEP